MNRKFFVFFLVFFFWKTKLFYLTVETFYVSGERRTKRKTRTRRRTWKTGKTCRLMAKERNDHWKGLPKEMHIFQCGNRLIAIVTMLLDQTDPREINAIFMQIIPFVSWNQHGRWSRDWYSSVLLNKIYSRVAVLKGVLMQIGRFSLCRMSDEISGQ